MPGVKLIDKSNSQELIVDVYTEFRRNVDRQQKQMECNAMGKGHALERYDKF